MKPSDFPRDPKFHDPCTPPFRDEKGQYHVFSYADVMRVLQNKENAFTRDPAPWLPEGPHHMALDFMWAVEPFTLEGEPGRHDALRAVVEPWFRTRAVRTMEPVIRELTVELLNEIVAANPDGEFNLARQLAYTLSMRVICRLTGIELEREVWLRQKLDEFARAGSYEEIPLQWDAQAYFWQLVARRLTRMRNELLDVLVEAWKEGRISDDELLGYLYGFVTAGTDTTGTSFVNAFALLAEFGQLDYARSVADDQDAMRKIVDEILRFGTPFPTKPLLVLKDVRFGDLAVPSGSVLNIWFAAANRDPAVNGGKPGADPEEFDPRRWPNRHLALGWGKHFCLGGDLSRLETRILLQESLHRLPELDLAPDRPFERFAGIVDGVTEAYFRFDRDRAARIVEAEAESSAPYVTPAASAS